MNNAVSAALVWQLLSQALRERYVGTALGVCWLLIPPLFMLMIYALVFGEILQMRTGANTDTAQFAAWLFAGLTAFNALAEVLTRSPTILSERRDVLLNSPLPPAVLPLLPVGVSAVLEGLSVGLLLLWLAVQGRFEPLGAVFYLPFLGLRLLFSLAFAYGLAVLGVFLRDLRQMMPPLLTVLLLVSPIVYPLSVVPEAFQAWFAWNPLAQLVEGYRAALLEGRFLWEAFLGLLVLASVGMAVGWWLFQHLWGRARYVL